MGKGGDLEKGLAPLLNALLFYSEESQREALPLLPKISPSPLRERGRQGVRVLVIGLKSPKSEAKIGAFEKLNGPDVTTKVEPTSMEKEGKDVTTQASEIPQDS